MSLRRRLLAAFARLLGFLAVVVVGVAGAKVAQNAAADYLGPELGFDLASAVGLVPVVIFYLWLAHCLRGRGRAEEVRP